MRRGTVRRASRASVYQSTQYKTGKARKRGNWSMKRVTGQRDPHRHIPPHSLRCSSSPHLPLIPHMNSHTLPLASSSSDLLFFFCWNSTTGVVGFRSLPTSTVRGLVVGCDHGPQAEVAQGLDLDLSLSAEVNIRKGWKENGGTK